MVFGKSRHIVSEFILADVPITVNNKVMAGPVGDTFSTVCIQKIESHFYDTLILWIRYGANISLQ
jgi:hypothetical protein